MMSEETSYVPIIDFGAASIDKEVDISSESSDSALLELADKLVSAFTDIGFVYLVNHGILEAEVNSMFKTSASFFELPQKEKLNSLLTRDFKSHTGYCPSEREVFKAGHVEHKESFDVCLDDFPNWPKKPEGLKEKCSQFFHLNAELARRIILLVGLGIDKQMFDVLKTDHEHLGGAFDKNTSLCRLLYYPPMEHAQEATVRCNEHTDYGTLTVLHQDGIPGLEVMNREGEFVLAKPIPRTVVVNIADMFSHYTEGRLKSTVHRVIFSEINKSRKSIAFFVSPDCGVLVKSPKGGNDGIDFIEYLNRKYSDSGRMTQDNV